MRFKLAASPRLATLGVFLAGGLALAGPSLADSAPVHVRTSDLDLNTQQGIAALYTRIERAAEGMCSPYDGAPLPQRSAWKACLSKIIDSAVDSSGNPRLVAYRQLQVAPHHATDSVAVAANN
jgi:UrcA family protein